MPKKKNTARNRKMRLLVLLVPVVAVVTLLAHLLIFAFFPAGDGMVQKVVEVRRGTPLQKIATELEQGKIITSARMFALYGRLTGAASRIQAGSYVFDDAMSPVDIVRKMVSGDVLILYFTVPEGYSIYQVAELLEQQGYFKKEAFLRECFNRDLLKDLGIKASSVEGYLYPSTYQMQKELTEADLIRLMVKQFFNHARDFELQANNRKMRLHEVLTLASIIEKEAAVSYERPLIASVFTNRLQKGMRLQSDPTAIYGKKAFGAKVTKKDILKNSAYNTYRIKGLPPGPIGNPSSEAIEAVLNPAKTGYLYFVAKRDGTHHFSTTLAEHNQAIRTYLKPNSAGRSKTDTTGHQNDHPNINRRR